MKVQNYSLNSVGCTHNLAVNHKARGGVRKRHRTHFTADQVEKLEEIFTETTCPHKELIVQLSTLLNLTDKNVAIWFKNRRALRDIGNTKSYGKENERQHSSLVTSTSDLRMCKPKQPALMDSRIRSPLSQSYQTADYNRYHNCRRELPALTETNNEQNPEDAKIFNDFGSATSTNYDNFVPSYQNSTCDIYNFHKELPVPFTEVNDVNYRHQSSGHSYGYMDSYRYPVNYSSTWSSLSPSSDNLSATSDSCFHDFPSLQAVVSTLSF